MSAATGSASFEFDAAVVGGHFGESTGIASFQFNAAAKSTVIEIFNSQDALITTGDGDNSVRDSQVALLTAGTKPAELIFNSQDVLLTSTQIEAKFVYDSQQPLLAVGANPMTDVNSSQVAILTMSRSNPDRRQMRAWTFYQDGHWFYVLHLGNTGTIVFDTLTRKWSEWKSFNYNNWRANTGVNWNEDVVAGSLDSNVLFQVKPDFGTDMGDPIVSVLTGGYPMRLRNSATCDTVIVTSSVGMSTGTVATMGLRTSDDYGLSWQDWGTLDLSTATPRTEVTWQSLGEITAPGRIFEITDSGAAKRINSLDMYSRDIQDG